MSSEQHSSFLFNRRTFSLSGRRSRVLYPIPKPILEFRQAPYAARSFGIDALPNGRVLGQNGEKSDVIFTLGAALKGTLWETTAIPEIRSQARDLAEVLLSD